MNRRNQLSMLLACIGLSSGCGGSVVGAGDAVLLDVAEVMVPCIGVEPRLCMLVREGSAATFDVFHGSIHGFDYEPGYRYRLIVRRTRVADPPADGSSIRHDLVRVVERDRSPRHALLEELRQAEQLWHATQPQRYALVETRDCFCGDDWRGPVRVEVERDGFEQVTGAYYVDSGEPVPAEIRWHFHGVQGLFAVVRQAIARDAAKIDFEVDAARGYPTRIWIDYSENMADEELGYRVAELITR